MKTFGRWRRRKTETENEEENVTMADSQRDRQKDTVKIALEFWSKNSQRYKYQKDTHTSLRIRKIIIKKPSTYH